jgi:pyruvate/2-oxoglutarate dehydrogenase complex dihydrolipoamide dehydrogenase (E3) component
LNQPVNIDVDALVLAAGRIPNVHGMDLEKAGVKYDERNGIHIGETMRTSNSKIYAVGDCCHPMQFTHMADQMARGVSRNACFFGSVKHTDFIIPRVTYTEPEIAQVGRNAVELSADGVEFQEVEHRFSDNDRAICDGETDGYIKMYVEKGKGTIYGCVIVANRAGEMISEVTLAMSNKLKLSAFSATIHPYPTYGEGFRKIADSFNGQRLTPGTKAILRKVLKVRR